MDPTLPPPPNMLHRSYRLDVGPYYTVINRTTRRLSVTVDGRVYVFEPGDNPDIPSAVAQYAVKQHPRRGTFDPTMQIGESLMAVRGITAPEKCTMIPPGKEHLGDELIDREKHPHKKPVELEHLPARRRLMEADDTLGRALASTASTGAD